ncbi:CBS domain-containing protein [Lentiprolixibacter aurantiacus]|uniref:CBS domain-containing protein n=1 Tax=Lentiprolixibacter aurantiacus TaxID=2993939 RepID=A0AAE3SN37_9FLAO|nr:CBS domain-containing protein [Lentiprolixibacter aurantiacus]MCX2719204.1 CBS domain-containing protein [Lentiprolixibacter aurantiacus]
MNVEVAVPISTIMTAEVITVKPNDSLDKAETLFKKHKIRHIPVVDKKRLVGMLSMNDLLRISFADGAFRDEEDVSSSIYEMFTIPQLMRNRLTTVQPDNSIREVAEIFVQSEYHSLPVVQGESLVGIVTTTDMIKYLLKDS